MSRRHWTVYRLYDADRVLLYVGCTSNLIGRVQQHASYREWARDIATVTCEHYDTKQEALDREKNLIRSQDPAYNSWPPKRRRRQPLALDQVPDEFVSDEGPFRATLRLGDDYLVSRAKRRPAFCRAVPDGKVHITDSVHVLWHDGGVVRATAACGADAIETADRPDPDELCGRCARSSRISRELAEAGAA